MTRGASVKTPRPPGAGRASRAVSPRVLAIAVAAALLLAAAVVWRVAGALPGAGRPDLPVHAGMYDLRAELQKAGAARQVGTARPGRP